MKYDKILFEEFGTAVSLSTMTMPDGLAEYEAMVTVERPDGDFSAQLHNIEASIDALLSRLAPDTVVVSRRYFLSDPVNQAPEIDHERECSISFIGQAPLDGSKIALWATLAQGAKMTKLSPEAWLANSGDYSRIYYVNESRKGEGSRSATRRMLDEYAEFLAQNGCSLADNCLRTWFIVKDIDVNYPGVVTGRNEAFAEYGLSRDTHFLASTGIGGTNNNPFALVKMDAFADTDVKPSQVTQLKALTHLNPTMEYGVAFERATAIEHDGWRHLIVSGTASIDNRGRVVHEGDVIAQAGRMLENIQALLAEGGCTFDDLSYAIVYLRDIADARAVRKLMLDKFPLLPMTIVLGPVCRPGWLIEMECSAKK